MKMAFVELKNLENRSFNEKQQKVIDRLKKILQLLTEREVSDEIVTQINEHLAQLNAFQGSDKNYINTYRKTSHKILVLVEKKLNLVTKNHYRNTWMVLGMSIFGVPIGVAFSVPLENFGLLGVGLPIGMAIGIGVGSGMDKKAAAENRQLDVI